MAASWHWISDWSILCCRTMKAVKSVPAQRMSLKSGRELRNRNQHKWCSATCQRRITMEISMSMMAFGINCWIWVFPKIRLPIFIMQPAKRRRRNCSAKSAAAKSECWLAQRRKWVPVRMSRKSLSPCTMSIARGDRPIYSSAKAALSVRAMRTRKLRFTPM